MNLDAHDLIDAIFQQSLDGVFVVEFVPPIYWGQSTDTPSALAALCAQQRITRINHIAIEQYRAQESQMLGQQPFAYFRHPAETAHELLREICSCGHAHTQTEETRLDGSHMTIAGNYQCIYDHNGRAAGYLGIRREITAEARLATQLTLLNEIARQIAAALSVNEVIQRAAALTHHLLGYHHVGIFLLAPEQDKLLLKACAGIYADYYAKNHQIIMNQGIVGWVAAHGKTRLCNDTHIDPQYVNLYPERVPSRSELSVPIEMSNNLLGVLDVQSPTTHAFSETDQTTLQTLADQIAVALENTQLTENLRTLFNGVDDMIFILDEQGNVLDTNHAAQRRLGYSESEIKALHVLNLHPANRHHEVQEIMTDLLAGRTNLCTVPLYTHSGSLIYVETQITRGAWLGKNALFGVSRDIGERTRTEMIMQARLRLMTYANAHPLAELLQAILDEIESLTGSQIGFYHFVHPDQKYLTLQAWSTHTIEKMCTIRAAGAHYSIEQAGVWVDCVTSRKPIIHNDYATLPHRKGLPDGHAPVIRELVIPVMRNDLIVAIVGVGNKPTEYTAEDVEIAARLADLAWDITENKRNEETLRQSEIELKRAQNLAKLGNYTWNLRTGQLFWSEALYTIFGLPHTQTPSYERTLTCLHPEDHARVVKAMEAALKYGTNYDLTYRIVRPDGEIRFVRDRGEILRGSDGNVQQIFGATLDITEQKRAEQLLELQRDTALNLSIYTQLDDVLHKLLEFCTKVQEIDCGGVYLIDRNNGSLWLAAAVGLSQQYLNATQSYAADSAQAIRVRSGQRFFTHYHQLTTPEVRATRGEALQAIAILPIGYQGRIIAALNLGSHTHAEISPLSRKLLETFSAQIGATIAHAESQESLRRSEQQLAAIFRLSPNPIAILQRASGKILAYNPAFEQFFGVAHSTQIGEIWLNPNNFATPEQYQQTAEQLRTHKTLLNHQITLYDAQKQRRVILLNSNPIDFHGEDGSLIILSDLTEHLQAEQQLQQQLERLAALKTIDQAISNQLDLESIFEIVLEQVRKTIPHAHKAIIHLWDEQQQLLVPVAVHGNIKRRPVPTIHMQPKQGLAGWVMDTGKSINSGNIAREPKFIRSQRTRHPKSLLVVPIQSQQDRFGTISVESTRENAFSVQDDHLISLLGIQAALAIKNARLFESERQSLLRAEAHARELETREQHLTLLNQITRAAMQSQGLPAMLQIFADRVGELFNAHGCYITLWDEATQRTLPSAAYGDKRETYTHIQVQPNEPTLTQTLLEKQKILLVDNTAANQLISQRIRQMFPTQCMLGIPLMLDEKKLGAILIDFQTPRAISPAEITLAEQAAGQIAIAIAKAHALQAEQQARQHAENLLTKLQHTQQHLIQTEKLAALGELVAGVAHELNNPLTSMILISQTIAQDPLPSPNRALLEKIGSEATRAAKIVRGLSDFARQRPLERAPIQINAIIKSTLELLAYELENANIQQQIQLDPALPLTLADPNQMQQVFINLANNARQAMHAAHGRGTLTIITRYGTAQRIPNHTHTIQICFADDGPGVSPEILGRIFDPFFTTKPLGVGTGLGLSICHGIVTEHGGQIWAAASPQGGACFWVEIPHQAPIADTPIEDFAPPMGNSATVHQRILLLDDEKVVLSVLTNALRRKGYQVDAFSNGKDALAMLDKATYDLVMTDIRMPDISGLEIYEQVCQRCPHLRQRFIFITGDVIHPRTRDFYKKPARLTLLNHLNSPIYLQP